MPNGLSITYGVAPLPDRPRCSVQINGFGRIRSASIEIAPLTILVGRNNTGKSYAASILWAARSGMLGTSFYARMQVPPPSWFIEYVEGAHIGDAIPLEFSGEKITPYVNDWLRDNGDALVADLLSLQGATIASLNLTLTGSIWLSPRTQPPEWARADYFASSPSKAWAMSWVNDDQQDEEGGLVMGAGGTASQSEMLFGMLLDKLFVSSIQSYGRNTAYIPAARTGLMLALKELTSSIVGSFGLAGEQPNRERFSKPMISFLQSVIRDVDPRQSPISEVADFLQGAVLSGDIEVSGKGSPTFLYNPTGTEMRLPMHAVSSMITELAPILTILRGAYFNAMVIEEPEAHLHLSAQRCMARAIARLVNVGVPVVVTTHSDTFLQQINLLLQLGAHPNRENALSHLGYTEEDVLEFKDVVGYEFIDVNGMTNVELAQMSEDGLIVNSLNETLLGLANDVMFVAEA